MIKLLQCWIWHIFFKPVENLRKPVAINNCGTSLYFYLSCRCNESYAVHEVSELAPSLLHLLHPYLGPTVVSDLLSLWSCICSKLCWKGAQTWATLSFSIHSVHSHSDTSLGRKSSRALFPFGPMCALVPPEIAFRFWVGLSSVGGIEWGHHMYPSGISPRTF